MAGRAVWQRTIVDERGNIIPGAEVTVRSYPGGSLVPLYESPEGAPKSNPFNAGADGFARFWAESQRAEIIAHGAGSTIRWIVDLINADEVIGGAVAEATAAAETAVGEAKDAADRAEAARDAAQLNARVFPTTAAGLAATSDGDYFSVPSAEGDEYLILYRNNSGSADQVERYPSAQAVKNTDQRVSDLASSEELQAIRAQGDSDDWAVAWTDEGGNIAAGIDKQGRFVGRIGQDVESYEVNANPTYVWGVADEAGSVALGVDTAGRSHLSGLVLPGAETVVASTPNVAFAIADEQGRAAFVVYDDGTTSVGEGYDPVPITHTVEWSFAETIDDPSKELFVTWLTNGADAKVLEYRPKGGQMWMSVSSFRTRPFPMLDDLYLHTVRLDGLTPNTVYEYRMPGSEYSDSVKTCPNLESIRMIMASDWQNTDYSESSPLRNFGDIATSKEPDLYIFNGDFLNADGAFTETWAGHFRSMFQVFHDHWRGVDGVQIPWVMTFGNHEGNNAAGTSNAYSGGNGTPGMLPEICSWTYAELHETKFARSVSTVRIRNLVAFICLETDHTVPISSQMDWMEDQLETHSPEVAHTFLVGHNPPFHHRIVDRSRISSNRFMRNVLWPIAQQYSDGGTLRAFLAGHSHALAATGKLKMAYDPGESDLTNDQNFYRDAGGFYCLGNGAVGAPNIGILDPPDLSFVSNIDDQSPWDALAGRDPDDNPLSLGSVQNMIWPPHNIWVFDISETGGWKAESLNANGDLFYEVDETE